MARRWIMMGILLPLASCSGWQLPDWLQASNYGSSSAPTITAEPVSDPTTEPPPGFVATTSADDDPRWDASTYCGKLHRYAQLKQTQLNRGNRPGDDTITWRFDCIY